MRVPTKEDCVCCRASHSDPGDGTGAETCIVSVMVFLVTDPSLLQQFNHDLCPAHRYMVDEACVTLQSRLSG